jgi:hypothetical protein
MSSITLQIGEDRFLCVRTMDGWNDENDEYNRVVYSISVGTSVSIQRPHSLNAVYILPEELDELARQLGRVKELMVLV